LKDLSASLKVKTIKEEGVGVVHNTLGVRGAR